MARDITKEAELHGQHFYLAMRRVGPDPVPVLWNAERYNWVHCGTWVPTPYDFDSEREET